VRVLLVQPPQSDPAQPYSSLAVLLAAWRAAPLEVDVLDLNLEFFDHLCSADNLRRSLEEVELRLSAGRYRDSGEKDALQRASCTGSWLESLTPKALAALRDPAQFFDPDRYAWAFRTIHRALEVISAPAYPGRITMQSFRAAHSCFSSRGIMAATTDEESNLFLPFCRDQVIPHMTGTKPDVLAVSVTFQTQLIPAFTLAAQMKALHPEVRIVFGGATISRIRDHLRQAPHLFRNVDAFMLFEGETAFPALLSEWDAGRDGLSAPNVLMLSRGEVRDSGLIHTEDLDLLPSPDHNGLPIKRYWTPEPALLVNSARGCYYGKCTFCMISPATWGAQRMGKAYRMRSIELMTEDVRRVCAQTGTRSINFANDILPPRALSELGDALAATGLGVTWDSEIRLERGLSRTKLQHMYAGGCRHLRFGFETASERVAALMDKGTDIEATTRILRDCRDIGISVCLLSQMGFPGETQAEAVQTVRFLQDHGEEVAFVSLTQFVLEKGSGVHRAQDRYGITVRDNDADQDLSWMYRFDRSDGVVHEDTSDLYEAIEAELDRSFPNRDLFFKGGLGHAHTTLYAARFGPAQFAAWNRNGFRAPSPLDRSTPLRPARRLSLLRQESAQEDQWSRYLISTGEVPELVAEVDGSLLTVLAAAALHPVTTDRLVQLVRAMSAGSVGKPEAEELVEHVYYAGFLLGEESDSRAVAGV
jgi:anaerobic magnesium-protoporphyrin IX monomethyl ester cyclase